ncbi:hypothetical protein STCU_08021 [Strigomonas culicis]|nr:hypothetical protein STCU_08021 [Strigomonas culicis]|eukprot:EPY22938.1 hypothetical protein STCU_08021 [Strigomonas culicis]
MVLPHMTAMGLVALWILVRRMWHSDRIFDLTELRRANLSATQIARRRQNKLFRSKYVPNRPVASRSFVKERYPTRGPPAY